MKKAEFSANLNNNQWKEPEGDLIASSSETDSCKKGQKGKEEEYDHSDLLLQTFNHLWAVLEEKVETI